jgi:hypothetical protein
MDDASVGPQDGSDKEISMIPAVLLAIPTIALPVLLSSPTGDCRFERMGDQATDARAVATFETAVNDYADLHRRLERAWPPMWFISDLEQVESVAKEFRAVLRDARPQATRGGFFAPEVADLFRFRMSGAVREQNLEMEALTSRGDETGAEGWWTPVINEPLPWGVAGTPWPIFEALPALPLELEYRLVGRDLVLLDVHANMVIDILDLAMPAFRDAEPE